MSSDAPVRLAVFDCDGTLVDGQAPVCDAMEAAFGAAGIAPPSRQSIRQIVGLSLPHAVRHLAPSLADSEVAAIVERYKTSFREARERGEVAEPLFAGIAELVERLRAEGWSLAVATGKSRRGLEHCLQTHGLTDSFDSLQTADGHPSKPDPTMLRTAMEETLAEPENTVMIGDTLYDMEMACAADVRAIGVSWGYHDTATLLDAGASDIAGDAGQLYRLICGAGK
ncbi:HAD-IA family hydrolase [Erythrobacteraceae bacterium WH01K]|nr:HAD-IA family hydrolase [Erythrobacteraceae bacterium WH01K]